MYFTSSKQQTVGNILCNQFKVTIVADGSKFTNQDMLGLNTKIRKLILQVKKYLSV